MSVPRTPEQKAHQKQYAAEYRKSAHGRAMRKRWLKTTTLGKAAKRSMHLVSRYGITWKQKVLMYNEQQGLCKLCHRPLPPVEHSDCHVEHNHQTDKIRGIVHRNCNHIIGWFEKHSMMLPAVQQYLSENA